MCHSVDVFRLINIEEVTLSDLLKRLDAYARALIFSDATEISLDAVYDIAEDTK